jgi:hypothetical protein
MAKRRREPPITEELREMIIAQPFQPFDLKTSDGDTFHVFHPDYCMISPSGGTAIVYQRADVGHSIVNLHHVVSIEPSRPRKGLIGGAGKK